MRQRLAAERCRATGVPFQPGQPGIGPSKLAATFRAFREGMPEATGDARVKASVPRKQYVVLQRIDAGRPYRKRRVRYQSATRWHGLREGDGMPGQNRVRMLPPDKGK